MSRSEIRFWCAVYFTAPVIGIAGAFLFKGL